MHYDIHRFSINGTADDSSIVQTFETWRTYILGSMYDTNCVPRHDIDEVRTINYTGKAYELQLSLYGIDIGEQCQGYYFGNSLVRTR